jgi:DNA repair photolyase
MKTKSGTKEWAPFNENIINGCSHDCKYCYARGMKIRFNQLGGREWTEEQLRVDPETAKILKRSGRIMYPTAHDITPQHLEEHVIFIRRQMEAGNSLLIVSKPHVDCVRRLCQEFADNKDRITFRFTIGSIDNDVLRFWEPGAPLFEERLESLQLAYDQGFRTSISAEPMLEGNVDALIDAVSPFVTDTIWLGKINRLKSYLAHNGFTTPEILARAEALMQSQNDEAIRELYDRHKNNPKMRFKESIKKVVGLELQSEAGMDV